VRQKDRMECFMVYAGSKKANVLYTFLGLALITVSEMEPSHKLVFFKTAYTGRQLLRL